jgi:hypothetical protein
LQKLPKRGKGHSPGPAKVEDSVRSPFPFKLELKRNKLSGRE